MKRILFFAFVLALASCSNNAVKEDKKADKKEVAENKNPDGDHVITKYTNGKPHIVRTFKINDGKRIATYEKEFYDDGNILKEGALLNGKRDGLWKSYRRDGILWSESNYKDGVNDGTTTTYHPNGNVYYKGEYKNGIKTGTWTFFNNKGDKVKTKDFGS